MTCLKSSLVAGCVVLLIFTLGCGPDPTISQRPQSDTSNPTGSSIDLDGSSGDTSTGTIQSNGNNTNGQNTNGQAPPNQDILIGSFNIQMFGVTKMSRPDVVAVLVDIARKFDILAIQELRDGDERVAKEFLEIINSSGGTYAMSVGPKQGYVLDGKLSTYYEQAIFLYDTTKVQLIAPTYVARDNNPAPQKMHRAPYVGHFQCVNAPPEQAYSFVLMNVHVDPDDAHIEFQSLRSIISEIYANHRGEDDFILIGDLNDSASRFAKYRWMQQQFAVIPSTVATNTRLTKSYDNIVFDANYTAEFTGQSGVLNFMTDYNLPLEQALKVSDHLPVWALFSNLEAPRGAITQTAPSDFRR
jgi:endonuclease/exonuclease/phosphatase family metal-dependent hydrolase